MLLDTHVVLWLLEDSPRLGEATRAALESGKAVHVSAVSIWEIAIKTSLGKLSVPDDLPDRIRATGLSWLDLKPTHAWAIRAVHGLAHQDPFDRALIAQAVHDGLRLVTADRALLEAKLSPEVGFVDART